MIKKVVIFLAVLIVAIGVASFVYFDRMAAGAIEVVGSRVLGTGVTVSSVSLSPLNGAGNIKDLRIQNAEGFSADYIFELGYVAVNINARSVFSETIEIETVTIAQPIITYETRITTDNIRSLLANIPAGQDSAGATAEPGGGSRQIIIRELQILDSQLNLSAGIASAPVRLPDIILHDIGTEADAATVAEALRVVLTALSRSILQADLPALDILRDSVESSVREAVDEAGDKVDEAVDNLGNRIRGILN